MSIPHDYEERVYAGVLGKMIGVYLGRPFEGWTYERIIDKLGEVDYYVNDRLQKPLVVTDDDLSGTFTFLRALSDYGNTKNVTAQQVGQTWLNYLIENRTVLWWGGMGLSTEHTAYLRLKSGVLSPRSGSAELNGDIVAEQIGAQIFIDGWGMVAPGDPELAADLAGKAASVSHDGEAIYGAQVIAAMEAQAFVEPNLATLLETAIKLIPKTSIICRMISHIREWHAMEPDWHKARKWLAEEFGYDKYKGNCHIVPNHGVIILGLLYGEDDFQTTLKIVNTCGWDTDCNSGNVGCLMGIKKGLACLDNGPNWRGPVNDVLYLPTADGGRCITDALTETYQIVNIGRQLVGLNTAPPKDGARFHFSLPGSTQGFCADTSLASGAKCTISNICRQNRHYLAIQYDHLAVGKGVRVFTPTFLPPDAEKMKVNGYELTCSPTIYAGQTVLAQLMADEANKNLVNCQLYLRTYGHNDEPTTVYGPECSLGAGDQYLFQWVVPDTMGEPIKEIGIEITSKLTSQPNTKGTILIDYLTWSGSPDINLGRPTRHGTMWQKAWTNGVDHVRHRPESLRLMQDHGGGLLIQGTREWADYRVTADVTPDLASSVGVCARVQGMRRYYALLLCTAQKVCLVKALDGQSTLAETDLNWVYGETYQLSLEVRGNRLLAWVDDRQVFDVQDQSQTLESGAIALLIEEGCSATNQVIVRPV